jgi:hypothetical protein
MQELTEQDVRDVWAAEFDARVGGPPEPYTTEDREAVRRGRALLRQVVLHESAPAIIGYAVDDEGREGVAAKSQSPVLAFGAGYIDGSPARRWVGLSWRADTEERRESIPLTLAQWQALDRVATETGSLAERGENAGYPSWRTLLRRIADGDLRVIKAE